MHDQMLACRDFVGAALDTALDLPRVHGADYDEWVAGIVDAVALAANTWAVLHDCDQVAVEDVARIDRSAMGHVDYHAKFALRVASLVVYGEP